MRSHHGSRNNLADSILHRPASQVMRELMRGYIKQRRQAREYDEYLRRKVEDGRASMRAGLGRSNDEVEAAFAARRNQVAAGQALKSSARQRRNKTALTFGTTSRPTTPARPFAWMSFSAMRPPDWPRIRRWASRARSQALAN